MQKNKIKLFLADDHPVLRDGIRILLGNEAHIEIVGEAGTGKEVLEKLPDSKANVLLLDIDMPEKRGLDIIKKIATTYPEINVLVFSMHDNDQYVRQMLADGAKGYILKSSKKEELIRALETVVTGGTYLCQHISIKLMTSLKINKKVYHYPDVPLTKREIDIIKLVAKGLTNKEIGELLTISSKTVATHRKNIMQKLNLHNAAALANYAAKKRIA